MFGFGRARKSGRGARRRARDGHTFLSGSERRKRRRTSGLTARGQKRVVKERRAYKSGKRSYRGRAF